MKKCKRCGKLKPMSEKEFLSLNGKECKCNRIIIDWIG
jgi:hypothetical protein